MFHKPIPLDGSFTFPAWTLSQSNSEGNGVVNASSEGVHCLRCDFRVSVETHEPIEPAGFSLGETSILRPLVRYSEDGG